jgi:GNAT superfamily N-acetyltransferase
MAHEWRRGEYVITTDPAEVDLDVVHGFLVQCYWATGIPREVVARSIQHSLNFSLRHGDRQIGFARVVTDRASVAYLGDVFVLLPYRGRGLSKWLMQVVVEHPDLQGLRRWILLTRDAHGLYEPVGFKPLARPERWMEKWDPDVYQRGGG